DERAGSAEHRRRAGDEHPPAAEPACDRSGVHAAGAAPGDKHRRPRVDALVEGDVLDGTGHLLRRKLEDRRGGGLDAEAERASDMLADRALRGVGVEPHAATEEVLGTDDAESHAGIGEGRADPALAVARRTWDGAGAARAEPEQAAVVHPG